ncbi:MAG TPA: hypothetical protein VHB21_25925, partial [Minicystis sp.]|nr:hypothetical protein [Minicystis sp.]
ASAPEAASSGAPPSRAPRAALPLTLPGGAPGIGFDDLRFVPSLDRVLVPGGRSGALFVVDPTTRAVEAIGGFSQSASFAGGHDFGVTSADAAGRRAFATDRTSKKLVVVDLDQKKIVAAAALGADPDYVRFVAPTNELWVTEPDAQRIEIFSLAAAAPKKVADVAVPGGPESLVVDAARGRAYTHAWKGATFVVDVKTRAVVTKYENGCEGSRGIDLDEKGETLFVGCAEGKAFALDPATGRVLGRALTGNGVDIIAYAPARRHLYVPAAKAATTTVLAVSPRGELTPVATLPAAKGSHCAASDAAGRAFVCDPSSGSLLAIDDVE